jgi:RHS repeat-associated protein
MTALGVLNTTAMSERSRKLAVDLIGKRLLVTNFCGTDQEKDLTEPANCGGLGRLRHFRRATPKHWPANPLPIDPACAALGLSPTAELRTQVFQLAVCNWRCWYCFVPFPLLAANRAHSRWVTASDLVDLYTQDPNRPRVIDLTGGQPDLVPEWVPWMMKELRLRGLENEVFIWSDDNLSTDYFWRYLTKEDMRLIVEYPKYGRVCCFKGFDAESFAYNTNDILFSSHMGDAGTGLIYMKQRWYSPELGRFLSPDPTGEGADVNRYRYCGNEPVDAVDPMGLWDSTDWPTRQPVHERMSKAAAYIANFDPINDFEFLEGLEKGCTYPDLPDGTAALANYHEQRSTLVCVGLYLMNPIVYYRIKPDPNGLTARSQDGDLSYWHSMAIPGVKMKPKAMQTLMVDWICQQYAIALAAWDTDPKTSGEQIGRALHTLEDSYALSHAARERKYDREGDLTFGAITRFQDYSVQDPTRHHTGDVMPNLFAMDDISVAGTCAALAAADLLKMLREGKSDAEVRTWLVEGPDAPLALSRTANGGFGCIYGGSEPDYVPRPKR